MADHPIDEGMREQEGLESKEQRDREASREECISNVRHWTLLKFGFRYLDAVYEHRFCTATLEALERYSQRASTARSIAAIFDDLVTTDIPADALREEGRRKGRLEGRIEGGVTALSWLLVFKFDEPGFAAIYESRLRRATPEVIEKYFQRALEAHSLLEVFKDIIGPETIADAVREEGRINGFIEGHVEASTAALRRLLFFKFKLTKLEAIYESRLRRARPRDFELYFRRALQADLLAEVFED